MDTFKRPAEFSDSKNYQMKKSRPLNNEDIKSSSQFEKLSNELFYEIFDYFDGYDLIKSFSNLNKRFDQLLDSSALRLKITFYPFMESNMQAQYMNLIRLNRYRIISLALLDVFLLYNLSQSIPSDFKFPSLKSLTLSGLESSALAAVILNLNPLSNLISLTVNIDNTRENFTHLYGHVLNLPLLKYVKISSHAEQTTIQLGHVNINTNRTRIEDLIMDHSCTLNELIGILSYTPCLRKLVCGTLNETRENLSPISFKLSELKYFSIKTCNLSFDLFELFLSNNLPQLEILRISTLRNLLYLNSDRWERLISKNLKKFYLTYVIQFNTRLLMVDQYRSLNKFTSKYWRERQWNFQIEIDARNPLSPKLNLLIGSFKSRKKLEYFDIEEECLQDIELFLPIPGNIYNNQYCIDGITSLFSAIQITQIELSSIISTDWLINITRLLKNLNSLTIHSLLLTETHCLLFKTQGNFHFDEINNNIKRIHLIYASNFEDIDLILNLSSNLKSIHIGCSDYFYEKYFQLVFRYTLMKIRKYSSFIRLLSFRIKLNNENSIDYLFKISQFENYFRDYSIQQQNDKLYLLLK